MRAGEVVDVELEEDSSLSIHIEAMAVEGQIECVGPVVDLIEERGGGIGRKREWRRTLHASSGQRKLNGQGSCSP